MGEDRSYLGIRSFASLLVAVACSPTPPAARVAANAAPTTTISEAPTAAPEASAPKAVASPATCDPSIRQPETLVLHRLVSEVTEWKAPEPTAGAQQVVIKILGFNDFHGQLSPPPPIEGRSIGGAAALAAHFRAAAKGFEKRTLALHAGDLIGASPPASALNQDEPTLEYLGSILGPGCSRRERAAETCPVVASLGNHEFDEGVDEFRRLLGGGNHPRGPFLGRDYQGAPFEYIGANVIDKQTRKPLVAPYVVKNLEGARVGLVGAVLHESPVFLLPSGIKKVAFEDEITHVNAAVDTLSKQGIHTIVVVLHQGGQQCFAPGVAHDERSVTGPIVEIVKQLHPDVDLVVSGHTHSVISALLPNSAGVPTLVTQAFHAGTGFAEIELTVDTAKGDVLGKRARIATPWADAPPGNAPDPQMVALVNEAEESVRVRTNRVVGVAAQTIHAATDAAGNSELGDLIAEAQRQAAQTDLAFTTPSWVRGDVQAGSVAWGDLFRVQPFGNRLVKLTLRGHQVVALLNQQWAFEGHSRILHVSGLTYQWDPKRAAIDRVVDVQFKGKPLDRKGRFTVVVNEYLAQGGDGFSLLASVPQQPTKLLDIEALETYFRKHSPVSPRQAKSIARLP